MLVMWGIEKQSHWIWLSLKINFLGGFNINNTKKEKNDRKQVLVFFFYFASVADICHWTLIEK